jgi:hypothetical protein
MGTRRSLGYRVESTRTRFKAARGAGLQACERSAKALRHTLETGSGDSSRARRVGLVVAVLLFMARPALAQSNGPQLNEHCTVSVLNRTVRANPDGSWVLFATYLSDSYIWTFDWVD